MNMKKTWMLLIGLILGLMSSKVSANELIAGIDDFAQFENSEYFRASIQRLQERGVPDDEILEIVTSDVKYTTKIPASPLPMPQILLGNRVDPQLKTSGVQAKTAVTFNDPNLEMAVREALEIPAGDITAEDMSTLTALYAKNINIRDLTGLEYANNLISLNLTGNLITDLTPIQNLSSLSYLNLGSNSIKDIYPLQNMIKLSSLYLHYNQIEDASVLENLTSLKYLYLHYNQITDINFLANMVKLNFLNLEFNQISDVKAVERLENLTYLNIANNNLVNILPLRNLLKLNFLYLHGNKLDDISALTNLTKLELLRMDNNNIVNIYALQNLVNLETLYLHFNKIQDITPLQNLDKLTYLHLAYNQVGDISALRNLVNLTNLYLHYNERIQDISSLSNLTNLTFLHLADNKVSDLSPLANLLKLDMLYLGSNLISDISPLQSLPKLKKLNLYDNKIKNINSIKNLKSLNELLLHYNEISDIRPVQHLDSLTYLHLSGNKIWDLTPVKNLTDLMTLRVGLNQISDITPVKDLRNLTLLQLGENQISDISPVQNLVKLTTFWAYRNKLSDISVLSDKVKLKNVRLEFNYIYDIAALKNLVLMKELNLSSNQLDNEDLPNLYNLDNLTSLNLRLNPGIKSGTAMQLLAGNLDYMNCEDIIWDGECGVDPDLGPSAVIYDIAPNPVELNEIINVDVHVKDSDNDSVQIKMRWGDGAVSEYTEFYPSGTVIKMNYQYTTEGIFPVRVLAQNTKKVKSGWSNAYDVEVRHDTPLYIVSPDSAFATEDDPFEYIAEAVDPEGRNIRYTFTNYPDWLTPRDSVISGTPGDDHFDTYFMVIASDGVFADTQKVNLIIFHENDPPKITDELQDFALSSGEIRILKLREYVEDPDDSLFTWEITSDDPNHLNVVVDNQKQIAIFTGSSERKNIPLHFKVSDPAGASDSRTINIQTSLALFAQKQIPTDFCLEQNYPNPFNPETRIQFGLPQTAYVALKVFDINGRQVDTLFSGKKQAGYHRIIWDATGFASGIYFIQMQAVDFQKTARCILLK